MTQRRSAARVADRPSPVIRRAGLFSRKETFASYLKGQGTNDLLRL
jgi:hypothetical protein